MGAKNSVLKNNTLSGKNGETTVQNVSKKRNPVSAPNIHDQPFAPRSKVNEKSHESAGSSSTKPAFHIKHSKISNANHKDCGNLVYEVKFRDEYENKKKPAKNKVWYKSRSRFNAINETNAKIFKPPSINNSETVLADSSDTNLSDDCADESHRGHLDDELYYLIFGEHFNSRQHTASDSLPLSLSEEILNYIDKNQRFALEDECDFVRKYFVESRFENNKKMAKQYDVLDKACSTNPNADIKGPSSLNVAFVKGMIYRRELYGPPIDQAGQPGPSQPQVPIGTEEYVITKHYNYGRDGPQTSMPGNSQMFGGSCAATCGKHFGMGPLPTTDRSLIDQSLIQQSTVEDKSNKNVIKLKKLKNTKNKNVKFHSSQGSINKKTGKKRSLVKKIFSKKRIAKTIALKPKSRASRKGTPSRSKSKLFKKSATSVKKSAAKSKKTSEATNLISNESKDVGLPSTSYNPCSCAWPWGNNFPLYHPCPPNPLFNQRLMEEEKFNNLTRKEEQNLTDDEEENFDRLVQEYKKMSSRSKNMASSGSEGELVPSMENVKKSKKVKKKKADGKRKPSTAKSKTRASKKDKSSKITEKHEKIDMEAKKKKKTRKPKKSPPAERDKDELSSIFKTKPKPARKLTNRDVDVFDDNNFLNSEKKGTSNIGVKKGDDQKYDILFKDDGNMKVKVVQVISGKNRVFTYNSGSGVEEETIEVKKRHTISPQKDRKSSVIASSQSQAKKINVKEKSPVNQKKITRGGSIDSGVRKPNFALSNTAVAPNESAFVHPSAVSIHSDYNFVHPSAPAGHNDKEDANKRDHKRKDIIKNIDENIKTHHDLEVRIVSPSLVQESIHPILEKLYSRDMGSSEDPNYTAEVRTDQCIVEGNKIECLTSIPHVKVVFDIPGTHGKKIETHSVKPKIATSQNDIHVDVGLDRLGPKFFEQIGHKIVRYDSLTSGESVTVKGDKPDQIEDRHYKRPLKVPQYIPSMASLHSVESTHMSTLFTDKKNQFNEPNKFDSRIYDANRLLDIQECISKMKLELMNECPCLAGRRDNICENNESESGSDKDKRDLHNVAKETMGNNLNKIKKIISINENEEGKKYHEGRDPSIQQESFPISKKHYDDSQDAEHFNLKTHTKTINDESTKRPESNVTETKSTEEPSLDKNKPSDSGNVTFVDADNGLKDSKKILKHRKEPPTGTIFQGQNLLERKIPDDGSLPTTNKEDSVGHKRPELSRDNKNRFYGTRTVKKVSKSRSTMNRPKNTVTDTKSAFDKKALGKKDLRGNDRIAFDVENNITSGPEDQATSIRKTGVFHDGKNLIKGAVSYNDSSTYKAKTIKGSNEGHSSTRRVYTKKKKEYSNTKDRNEMPLFSGRVQNEADANKIPKEADAVKSWVSKSGNGKLEKASKLKKVKTPESKPRMPSAQRKKLTEEKLSRCNGATVEKVWADHRLEKAILTEKFNQAKRSLNSKCPPPDMSMKCCCKTICQPKFVICEYRCPSSNSPY